MSLAFLGSAAVLLLGSLSCAIYCTRVSYRVHRAIPEIPGVSGPADAHPSRLVGPELYWCVCGDLIFENPPGYAYRYRHDNTGRSKCATRDGVAEPVGPPSLPADLADLAEVPEPDTAAIATAAVDVGDFEDAPEGVLVDVDDPTTRERLYTAARDSWDQLVERATAAAAGGRS